MILGVDQQPTPKYSASPAQRKGAHEGARMDQVDDRGWWRDTEHEPGQAAQAGIEGTLEKGKSYPTVNLNSVLLPRGPIREHFLRGVGFPDSVIEYYDALYTHPIQFDTCFISYHHTTDHIFAKRLYNDLQRRGVRCWLAPHDKKALIGHSVLMTKSSSFSHTAR